MTNAEDDRYTKRLVLDHGYVQLLDAMGDDKAIVDAARLSIAGENVRAVSEDRGLIRYLMRHRHSTPFEMVSFKFMIKLPIFVERQMIRHRTAKTNEMSGRYSELPEEFYVPAVEDIQMQATKNKQGRSEDVVSDPAYEHDLFRGEAKSAFASYKARLDNGMAREIARNNLPVSTYTQKVWKMDLHNLFHFLQLRLHSHAQYEIRVYAQAIAEIVKTVCPIAYEAFEDFRLNAVTFSGPEMAILAQLIQHMHDGYDTDEDTKIDMPTKREAEEFRDKLRVMKFFVPVEAT